MLGALPGPPPSAAPRGERRRGRGTGPGPARAAGGQPAAPGPALCSAPPPPPPFGAAPAAAGRWRCRTAEAAAGPLRAARSCRAPPRRDRPAPRPGPDFSTGGAGKRPLSSRVRPLTLGFGWIFFFFFFPRGLYHDCGGKGGGGVELTWKDQLAANPHQLRGIPA